MRTTIELPDDLLRMAKIAAAERGATLRELVMEGLRKVLHEVPEKPDAGLIPKLPAKGRKNYDLDNAQIDSLLMAEEAKRYGRAR